MSGNTILPTSVQSIDLDIKFADGFLQTDIATPPKNPKEVLSKILRLMLESNRKLHIKCHIDNDNVIVIEDDFININIDEPKSDSAFFTWMLGQYHQTCRLNTGNGKRFNVNLAENGEQGHCTIPIYCLKGTNYKGQTDNINLDQDVINASIYWLNLAAPSLLVQGNSAMHPLSRVGISDENLQDLQDFINTDERMINYRHGLSVQYFNAACTKRSHQFYKNTDFYIPELAAASLVMNVMTSNNITKLTRDIANKSIMKIAGLMARNQELFNKDLMIDLMGFCNGVNSSINCEEIYEQFNKRKQTNQNVGKAAGPVTTGYFYNIKEGNNKIINEYVMSNNRILMGKRLRELADIQPDSARSSADIDLNKTFQIKDIEELADKIYNGLNDMQEDNSKIIELTVNEMANCPNEFVNDLTKIKRANNEKMDKNTLVHDLEQKKKEEKLTNEDQRLLKNYKTEIGKLNTYINDTVEYYIQKIEKMGKVNFLEVGSK